MVLSEMFTKSVHDELRRLKDHRQAITSELDSKIQELENLLGQSSLRSTIISVESREPAQPALVGFAPSVMSILSKHRDGLRPSQVSEYLTEGGFKLSGNIPLKERVAGELSRLYRNGKVKRKSDGLYHL